MKCCLISWKSDRRALLSRAPLVLCAGHRPPRRFMSASASVPPGRSASASNAGLARPGSKLPASVAVSRGAARGRPPLGRSPCGLACCDCPASAAGSATAAPRTWPPDGQSLRRTPASAAICQPARGSFTSRRWTRFWRPWRISALNYERHSRAALALARQYLNYDVVLGRLLHEVGP